MKKLAVFDLDSTLLDGESINMILNQRLNNPAKKKILEEIRARGMAGELDLESSLKQRIAFFRGISLQELEIYCNAIPWTKGAKATIAELKRRGYLTVCLSGGFRTITRRSVNELGVDAYCCNRLAHSNGVLTGEISGNLMHHKSKGEVLNKIQLNLNISPQNTLVVGDGANDLSLFDYAYTRIAFCAQRVLQKQATHIIRDRELSQLLDCI